MVPATLQHIEHLAKILIFEEILVLSFGRKHQQSCYGAHKTVIAIIIVPLTQIICLNLVHDGEPSIRHWNINETRVEICFVLRYHVTRTSYSRLTSGGVLLKISFRRLLRARVQDLWI